MQNRFSVASRLTVLLLASVFGLVQEGKADTLVLTPTADARILSIFPNTNQGSLFSISVFNDGATNVQRSLIRFDLSSIPAGAPIKAATLRLIERDTVLRSNGLPTFLYRASSDWSEGTVTWNQASGWFAGTNGGAYASGFDIPGVSLSLDAKQLVQEWVDGMHPNYGFFLLAPPGNHLHFHSKETTSGSDAFRPQLIIDYESGTITETALQVPAYDPSTSTVDYQLWIKGSGTGEFSGKWVVNSQEYARFDDVGFDFPVAATWINSGVKVTLPMSNMRVTASVEGEVALQTAPINVAATRFQPSLHGWKFANTLESFGPLWYAAEACSKEFVGVCLGMVREALWYYVSGLPISSETVPSRNTFGSLLESQRKGQKLWEEQPTGAIWDEAAAIFARLLLDKPAIGALTRPGSGHAVLVASGFDCHGVIAPTLGNKLINARIFFAYDPNVPMESSILEVIEMEGQYFFDYDGYNYMALFNAD